MRDSRPFPRFAHRGAALLLAASIAFAPGMASPQADNLPRLGDAGADELTPAAERRLGEQIMRSVRRDVAVSDDAEIADYLNRLVARLAAVPAAAGHSFEPFLVRDPTLNAFASGSWYTAISAQPFPLKCDVLE